MTNLKRFIPILLLLTLFVIPLANALEVIISTVDGGSWSVDVVIAAVHPSATAPKSAYGNSFRSRFDDANLTTIQVWAYQSAATGGCTAYLIGETGTFGSSSLPTGAVLATSSEVTITAGALTVYNFTFASGYVLDSAVDYCFYIAGTSGDVANEYLANDASAPLNTDPAVGNEFYYASSTWTAVAGADLCYIMYGQDGSAVSFNIGGDVTVVNNTNNYTVSAGDVSATGNVSVGSVTADFNNTAVTASGNITAGAVTAGDVALEGTLENATLTMNGGSGGAFSSEFLLVMFLLLGSFVLMFIPRIPIINLVFGIFSIAIAAATLSSEGLPYTPYINLLLGVAAALCMLSAAIRLRGD